MGKKFYNPELKLKKVKRLPPLNRVCCFLGPNIHLSLNNITLLLSKASYFKDLVFRNPVNFVLHLAPGHLSLLKQESVDLDLLKHGQFKRNLFFGLFATKSRMVPGYNNRVPSTIPTHFAHETAPNSLQTHFLISRLQRKTDIKFANI